MENLAVSDLHKLAVLDLHRISPIRTEHNGRFWAFFPKDKAEKLLADYDAGTLKVVARDFVASVSRVKDRIFEHERAMRAQNGIRYAGAHR